MSQIHILNKMLSQEEKQDYYFYCLESHGELTFILEYKGKLVYANIMNVMVTHNDKNHKDIIDRLEQDLYNQ